MVDKDFDTFYLLSKVQSLLDNWLDVTSIIVEKTFGFDTQAECDVQARLLSPAAYSKDVFGTNRTIVVGLTPGLYAVTDGFHAQYFNHYDGVDSVVSPNIWPCCFSFFLTVHTHVAAFATFFT
jgi:hypothetical protein